MMAWQILYTKTENNKAILFSVMAEGAAKARVRVSIMGPYLCGSLRPSSTHAHYQGSRNPGVGGGLEAEGICLVIRVIDRELDIWLSYVVDGKMKLT